MHASFRVGDSTVLASDGRCAGPANSQGVQLALR
jgi:PhnB protein